jgi:predicted metalloprotease
LRRPRRASQAGPGPRRLTQTIITIIIVVFLFRQLPCWNPRTGFEIHATTRGATEKKKSEGLKKKKKKKNKKKKKKKKKKK